MATYTEEIYLLNAANTSSTLIATLSEEIENDSIPVKDTLAYKTYATTYTFTRAYIPKSSTNSTAFSYQNVSLTKATDQKLDFIFYPRMTITPFAWTSDDTTKIVKGAPYTALTAEAWNRLVNLVKQLNLSGMTFAPQAFSVSKGDVFTYANFRGLWRNINVAQRVIDATWGKKFRQFMDSHYQNGTSDVIYAETLANHEYSVKSAINRLIDYVKP